MTVTDVAREARVSVASVSRVVNGHPNVTPETRQRILEAIDRLHYVPHTAARGLITKRTHVIGVLLPDLYGGFFSELIRGIDGAAREQRLQLLLSSSHGDAAEMVAAIRAMRGRIEGLLILASQIADEALGELDPSTPTVFMNGRGGAGGAPAVSIDSYEAAREMVRHLVGCGHTSIVHIAGPAANLDAQERERGYRDELAASLPGARARVLRGDFTEASGYTAGHTLGAESRRPSAVFAANDGMAIGCVAAFDELGLAIPRNIAVTGFDDIPLASFVRPALTTMRVRIADLGRCAVQRLVERIADPAAPPGDVTWIRPDLVIRESCGAVVTQTPPPPPHPPSERGHDGTEPARVESRDRSHRPRRPPPRPRRRPRRRLVFP
jgi:LacI family transcriptional regulator